MPEEYCLLCGKKSTTIRELFLDTENLDDTCPRCISEVIDCLKEYLKENHKGFIEKYNIEID